MNFLKRGTLFLLRKKGKAITLLLILIVSFSLVLMCLSINRGAENAARQLRESIGGYFKIGISREGKSAGAPTKQMVDDILANVDGIKAVNTTADQYIAAENISLVPGHFTSIGDDEQMKITRGIISGDSELHEYFYLNNFTLAEGEYVKNGDTDGVLISDKLAAMNNIGIGDSIVVTYPADGVTETYDLTVTGIYQIELETGSDSSTPQPEYGMQENFIFISNDTYMRFMEKCTGQSYEQYGEVMFFVTDPGELERVISDVTSLSEYNWEGYEITRNNVAYDRTAVPLERMSGLITVLILVIIAVSIVILCLVLVMWMRDRKHEAGVFMAIGIKKSGIILQHMAENLIVAVIAFALAVGVSSAFSKGLGDVLLEGFTSQAEEEIEDNKTAQYDYWDTEIEADVEAPADMMNVQTGAAEVLTVLGIGIAAVVIATGVSSIVIVRIKPGEILSSMS